MRAGENRGILSRVLTIYKQTFIFQIFSSLLLLEIKAPTPPSLPLQSRAVGGEWGHTAGDTGRMGRVQGLHLSPATPG